MPCIIAQLNHIYAILSVLSRRDGDTILIKMSVPWQTQWLLEQLRLRRIGYLPTLYSGTGTTSPSQLEILTDSVEIHFTVLLLCYQSFALITLLFFLPLETVDLRLFFFMELDKIR